MYLHRVTLVCKPEGVGIHETQTRDLDRWLSAFYCSTTAVFQCKDWTIGTITLIEAEEAGPLEPYSNEPPTPISYYPNRVNSIEPFPIGWS